MSKELNKAPVEQAEPASCQGTNCGTTTGDHSSECLAEAAASQGWELKPGDLCGRDCPMRPDPVEQAGGDERAVDGKPRATKCPDCGEGDLMPGDLCACGYETDPAAGYACSECDGSGDGYVGEVCRECDGSGWFVTPEQARAALAQPSGEVVVTKNESGAIVSVTRQDKEGRVLSVIAESATLTAQAEQAEAERPEVVAWQYRVTAGPQTGWSLWHPGKGEEFERSYTVERRPLMTVAQHERIVGALRADRDSWAEQAEQRLADWDEMRKERDAILARVAELETALEPFAAVADAYDDSEGQGTSKWANLGELSGTDFDAYLDQLRGYNPVMDIDPEHSKAIAKRGRDAIVAQAEGAPVIGCLCGMPMTEGRHSPGGCTSLEEFAPHLSAQAQAKQAEQPEVVARVDGTDEDWFIQPEDETELHNEGLLFAGCELGRMIDFDRIVGALRAENAKLSEALDECDGDRWKLRSERDAANARLHEVATACATAEQERDAALARVAELEQKSAGSWTVDTSCGRPILMYEGCSVIEDQTAYEVIRMIKWIGELERQERPEVPDE